MSTMPESIRTSYRALALVVVVLAGLLSILGTGGGGGGGGGGSGGGAVPPLPWKTFGGSCNDKGWSVQQTSDGGYIIAGFTCSFGAGGYDVYLIKTDAAGNVLKEKTLGGAGDDFGFAVQQTSDGGYIVTGAYNATFVLADPAFPADLTGELFLRKMDPNLDLEWEQTIQNAFGYSVQQTSDGGYVVAGATGTGGGGGAGLLVKTDAAGVIEWEVSPGGEYASGVRQTADGGYVVSFGPPGSTGGIVKTDAAGAIQWSTVLNGSAAAVWNVSGGGYVVTGIGNFGGPSQLPGDLYLAKTDASGTLLWEKTFGSAGGDQGHSVQQTADLGYIATGRSSFGPNNGFNVYLVKTDADGNLEWQKDFGGAGTDIGRAVRQTSDGGYVIVGDTTSGTTGDSDVFLLKTDASGNVQ